MLGGGGEDNRCRVNLMQGGEFTHWFVEPNACFLWVKQWIACEKSKSLPPLFGHELQEQIAHDCPFVKSNKRSRANYSCCSLKKSDWAKSNGRDSLLGIKRGKAVKNCQKIQKIWIISSKLLVVERDLLESPANHSCYSFLQRDESDSLTVALLSWATWADSSWLLFS